MYEKIADDVNVYKVDILEATEEELAKLSTERMLGLSAADTGPEKHHKIETVQSRQMSRLFKLFPIFFLHVKVFIAPLFQKT